MQSTATLTTPDTKPWGSVEITASRTIDGGYAINTNTRTGGTRHDNLCFTTPDRGLYRLAYRVIGEAGLNGRHPDDIHAALQNELRSEFTRALDTGRSEYAGHVEALLDALTTPAQAEVESTALAGIAHNIRTATGELSALGRIREAHAAGRDRGRAERSAA